MKTTIRLEADQSYAQQVPSNIQHPSNGAEEHHTVCFDQKPFDPTIKLTHEALFALPEEQQMQYFKAHGGVLMVMKENGYGLTQEDIDDWHRYKAEEDKILASLSWEEALKRIYGKSPR